MAIVREELTIRDKEFIKTYSDLHFYIERDGVEYEEAIDPIEFADERIYTETDISIETDEATEEDYIEALERLGVTDEETSIEE